MKIVGHTKVRCKEPPKSEEDDNADFGGGNGGGFGGESGGDNFSNPAPISGGAYDWGSGAALSAW